MSAGLTQPQSSGNGQTASFLFKVLVSVLTVVISAGVLALFNMNILIVRLDERFISFEHRMVVIERIYGELAGVRSDGITNRF